MIKLGSQVREKVSGFTGIAVSRTEFLNGCVRISVQPPVDKDGKFVDERWFDEQQIEVIGDGVIVPVSNTGGEVTSRPPWVAPN